MTAALGLIGRPPAVGAVPRVLPLPRPGVIGAAALKAARRSARMTRRRLARVAGSAWPPCVRGRTAPARCTAWTTSSSASWPTYSRPRGTCVGADVAELALVSQCDLLIAGMLDGFEDYAEVPPIEEPGQRGDLAREFVRWALAGIIPDRLLGVADRGPLLAPADAAAITCVARDLQAGAAGPELAAFGAALLTLAER